MVVRTLCLLLICLPLGLRAEERPVSLHAPEALVATGVFDYVLPRFSLKTRVRVARVDDPAEADIVLGETGRPLMQGADRVWRMQVPGAGHAGTDRLAEWLTSEIGQRTIRAFAPEGRPIFAPPPKEKREVASAARDGDAEAGHRISRAKCTRCHAVDVSTRGWGIGSTPSFGVLRALPDWESRFAAFYALNPHPAFTQIVGVTEPFPVERPSPIVPITMTLDHLDALLAYVAVMQAADLGAPLQHQ